MPIHEYTCRQCGHEFEELVRTAEQQVSCPKCDGRDVQKKLSAFSAVVSASKAPPCGEECPRGSCCCGGACHMH
jgi:putative FmdB family regulatory protein